ncbi:alpha/beta hydrolase [Pseudonocardia sp. GCM10023141]|uniref:alpha/beta hydrolase n=1 Tax=Pseudonocardia sp. GCM10023141 TaxID=3252653 RepID=UPI00361986F8
MDDTTVSEEGARFDTDPIGVRLPAPERLTLTSADGVRLHGVHLPTGDPSAGTALVVCHGFTHHTGHPTSRSVLTAFARHAPVVAVDMRGHGRSGGRSSVGDREILDLDAAVGAARAAGYVRIVTVGFSLGGAVALRHAALGAERPDAIVAVSPPARWYSRETAPMRRVHWLLEQPHGRLAARLLKVRLGGTWDPVPASPVEVVADIAPTPLLLVHFTGDPYFTAAHSDALVAASGGHAEQWTKAVEGHGESGTDPAIAALIARWGLAAVG